MNKRLEKVKIEHLAWLTRNGVSPDQLKARKKARKKYSNVVRKVDVYADYYKEDSIEKLFVQGKQIGTNKGIIANLYKESEEVQKEIKRKAQCVAPLYNKGGLQYVGNVEQAKHIGRK